jgi:isopenicillin N synthase-like dioxygenase
MDKIPVVSIGERFDAADVNARERAAELRRALESIGFAYIVDHGLPQSLLDDAFAASREFHASSAERKASLKINEFHRGYMGYATSTIVTSSVAKVTKPNLSESLMLMHELPPDDPEVVARLPLQGPNQWPDWMPGFRPTVEAYIKAADAVARRLVRMIATGLDLPETFLDRFFARPTTFLRLLHYPPQPLTSPDDQFGSAPHTDYGIITVLAQDSSGGLQVKPRGRDWIDAPPIPGSFVLNVADMLARWTNDRFVSTPHRVINKKPGDRYSLPYFFDTDMNAIIECLPTCTGPGNPPRYAKVRYGDYLMERLNKNYDYRKPERAAAGM